jgi:hypothetical protein
VLLCVVLVVDVTQPHTASEAIRISTRIANSFLSIQVPLGGKFNQMDQKAA